MFSNDTSLFYQITPINQLRGKKAGRFLLFGMLNTIQDGKYFLEDLDAYIELEFHKSIERGEGLFTKNCFLLVQGEYTDQATFRVDVIGHPLFEPRVESVSAYGNNIDFFGGHRFSDDVELMRQVEQRDDVSFVILSDVWLDQSRVLDKLRVLFEGLLAYAVPLAVIMTGNFSSVSSFGNGTESSNSYKEGFDNLADLIAEFPLIAQQSHFVFVPGPNDPWASNLLPRMPIPKSLTTRINQKVQTVTFATSPCRYEQFSKL